MYQKYEVLNNIPASGRTCTYSILIKASEICGVKQEFFKQSNLCYSVLINASEVSGFKQQYFNRKNLCIQCSNQCIRSMWCQTTILQAEELMHTVF